MMTAGLLEKDMEVGGGSFLRVIMYAALFSLSSVAGALGGLSAFKINPPKNIRN
jgi:zinc transporter ZupT